MIANYCVFHITYHGEWSFISCHNTWMEALSAMRDQWFYGQFFGFTVKKFEYVF
jgi:hypothetical protein